MFFDFILNLCYFFKKEVGMKRLFFLMLCCFLTVTVFPQQITEESTVINIEVPVRVFKDGNFVENLTIEDFEIFEEGIPQKIEAVYLVKKKTVERSEEKRRFAPATSRTFFLFFEISEYTSKIGEAIDYFHEHVIVPGDNLIIVTPMETYMMRSRAIEYQTRQEISRQLKDLLRKETMVGNAEYRGCVQDLIGLSKSLSTAEVDELGTSSQQMDEFVSGAYDWMPLEKQLMKYQTVLDRLEKLRRVDQKKLLDFAEILRNRDGQKYVFLIYQREYIPQIEPNILNKFIAEYQDQPHILRGLYRMVETSHRNISFDVELVKKAFADSSISIHFLFLTPPIKHINGVYFQERSEDIYGAFREMAEATGGFIESSANAVASLKQAVDASENYYLLYYSPLKYEKDGKFKEISIQIKKGKDYKIIHRQGYYAN
jgi:hypothetical protein